MVWFRESWYEEVQQQLRQGLAKCYTVAFENNSNGVFLCVVLKLYFLLSTHFYCLCVGNYGQDVRVFVVGELEMRFLDDSLLSS